MTVFGYLTVIWCQYVTPCKSNTAEKDDRQCKNVSSKINEVTHDSTQSSLQSPKMPNPTRCLSKEHETRTSNKINKSNSYFVARINLPQTETADLMLMVMPASKILKKNRRLL